MILILSFNSVSVSAESNLSEQQKQDLTNQALDNVIEEVNKQIKQGKTDINEFKYIPEIDDYVGIEFSIEEIGDTSQKSVIELAAKKPSGVKSYSGKVNGGTFTHTLLGEFTYGGGKVKSASREVRASGIAFSHTRSSKLTKLDPSVWQVSSTSKHRWLGTIGKVTGTGYTSYITINLYGSGNAVLKRATYKTGV